LPYYIDGKWLIKYVIDCVLNTLSYLWL
jgi:hypothetical protein